MRKPAVLLVLFVSPSQPRRYSGSGWRLDWPTGRRFMVLTFEKTATGYKGHLTNPSGNETEFDQVTCDGGHLHFAVNKLNLSYDSVWDEKERIWNGNLTFQQVYPLMLDDAAKQPDLAPVSCRRAAAIGARGFARPYREQDIRFDNPAGHNENSGTLSVPNEEELNTASRADLRHEHNTRDSRDVCVPGYSRSRRRFEPPGHRSSSLPR